MGFGAAIRGSRKAAGLTQTELKDRLRERDPKTTIDQSVISRWENESPGRAPDLDDLAALEDALDLPRGGLLVRSGFVAEVVSVELAVMTDQRLDDQGRQLLINAYRGLVQPKPGRRRGAR